MENTFNFSQDSKEYKYWAEYAQMALEYGFTNSEEEKNRPPRNIQEYVALQYGVSVAKMTELRLFL